MMDALHDEEDAWDGTALSLLQRDNAVLQRDNAVHGWMGRSPFLQPAALRDDALRDSDNAVHGWMGRSPFLTPQRSPTASPVSATAAIPCPTPDSQKKALGDVPRLSGCGGRGSCGLIANLAALLSL